MKLKIKQFRVFKDFELQLPDEITISLWQVAGALEETGLDDEADSVRKIVTELDKIVVKIEKKYEKCSGEKL